MAATRKPPRLKCKCGLVLEFMTEPHAWCCPVVIERHSHAAGRLNPVLFPAPFVMDEHITCLPAEVVDEDDQPLHDTRRARGMAVVDPPKMGPAAMERAKTWWCNDCGFRSPSAVAMTSHLQRHGHSGAENALMQRVDRP